MYTIEKTEEFEIWYVSQPEKHQLQIDRRLDRIEKDGHFGDHKKLTETIYELKWRFGTRVYYTKMTRIELLILMGGNKNGQDKDIRQAEKIRREYVEEDL